MNPSGDGWWTMRRLVETLGNRRELDYVALGDSVQSSWSHDHEEPDVLHAVDVLSDLDWALGRLYQRSGLHCRMVILRYVFGLSISEIEDMYPGVTAVEERIEMSMASILADLGGDE